MSKPRGIALLPAAMLALGSTAVSSQNYPNKPIRIVTSVAGGR